MYTERERLWSGEDLNAVWKSITLSVHKYMISRFIQTNCVMLNISTECGTRTKRVLLRNDGRGRVFFFCEWILCYGRLISVLKSEVLLVWFVCDMLNLRMRFWLLVLYNILCYIYYFFVQSSGRYYYTMNLCVMLAVMWFLNVWIGVM